MALSPSLPTHTPTFFVDIVPARREHTPPIHTQVTFSFPHISGLRIDMAGAPSLDLPPTLTDYASNQGLSFPHRTLCA